VQWLEAIVRQNEGAPVIRLEIIDRFAKDTCPEFFAHELDVVELCLRTGLVG